MDASQTECSQRVWESSSGACSGMPKNNCYNSIWSILRYTADSWQSLSLDIAQHEKFATTLKRLDIWNSESAMMSGTREEMAAMPVVVKRVEEECSKLLQKLLAG